LETRYEPSASLTTLRTAPVSVCVTVTVAPGQDCVAGIGDLATELCRRDLADAGKRQKEKYKRAAERSSTRVGSWWPVI
jgi:hypothetical protein